MKRVLCLFFILFCGQLIAQDKIHSIQATFPANSLVEQSNFLKELFPELDHSHIQLKLELQKTSPYSNHFHYDILFENVPLFNQYIKVHTNNENKIISVVTHFENLDQLSLTSLQQELNNWPNQGYPNWLAHETIKNEQLVLIAINNRYEIAQLQQSWGPSHDKSKLINAQNEVIQEWNHIKFSNIDTFINAQVFSPDPLTFLMQNYGAPYLDNNDANATWMTPAYIPVNINATYDNIDQKFYLENKYVKITDFEAPSIAVPNSTTPSFYFDRSQAGFEECMILYHIQELQQHLNNLGYDTLMNLQVQADAHGQFGGDNSVFNRNGGAPTLSFGTGGVDDAEDADVIVHEYAHGLSWSANANSFFSTERSGLDEGIGDYFATSYSRNLSNFRWEDVFTWDGHNTFFNGRSAALATNYSIPFSGGIYVYGEIWNTALQLIYSDLGRNKTDALALETLFYLTNNTTLPQAAHYMLQADTVLFNGVNVPTLCAKFQQKNILTADCFPVSVASISAPLSTISLRNSAGFRDKGESMYIHAPNNKYHLRLLNMHGQLVESIHWEGSQLEYSPQNLPAGLYILVVESQEQVKSFKIVVN